MYRATQIERPLTRDGICSTLDITPNQFRHWVRLGLISKRTSRRHPEYSHDDLQRAKVIKDTLYNSPVRTLADLRDRFASELAGR